MKKNSIDNRFQKYIKVLIKQKEILEEFLKDFQETSLYYKDYKPALTQGDISNLCVSTINSKSGKPKIFINVKLTNGNSVPITMASDFHPYQIQEFIDALDDKIKFQNMLISFKSN